MKNQDSQTEETVTLLLDNKRFKINKKKLIKESRYFATLLSTTYADHRLSEHFINYEIPLISFQDFIKWINSDTHNTIKMDFERYDLGRLLILLDLSVLFAVDNLTENITEILEKYHLLPQDVLNIWLLAQELGLKTLQDLCLAVCLDRFTELPRNLIVKLSRQNFLRLVGNSNLRVPDESELYLLPVAMEWMQINQDTIPLDILKKTGPKVYSSIICYNGSNSSVNNEFYIYCWDGDKLFELTTFKYPEAITNNNAITGMQITARGHHLYLSGGEFGIGTGRFNTCVWRYSLITKRWFLETVMPCARRHMIAAFLQNKLLLAGGVGHFRCKLQSLDIYNVHEGTWVKGAVLPMEFVTTPDYYVFDKKLIIYIHNVKSGALPIVYIYFCDSDEWYRVPIEIDHKLQLDIRELSETMPIKFKTASCYIDNKPNRINLRTIIITCDNLEYRHEIYKKVNVSSDQDVSQVYFYLILSDTDLYENNVLICLKNNNCMLLCLDAKKEKLQWHSIPIQNQDKFRSLSSHFADTIFFNLMDPANLHVMSATNLECTT